ncbi:helix-turn-helix domain-containing protein [Francisella sp. Scap27]|uniref:IclR family transcriptional regulator n=1 Tax=Francisella sp. Scap27 TaxID=2589986 RepID=UPI0015BBE0E9|nr:helix-turn-helix domain-containing protein [Francisella sp. Scap27]QLE78459.1 helix-turn-helix domain-containing protein [Francisella sp. Scap27]
MSEEKKIQVISRAIKILESISKNSTGMSLGEIAQSVNLPRSTVQRIVAALESEGYTRSEGAGKILLGTRLFNLVSSSYADIVSLTQNYLRKLSEFTQETVIMTRSNKLDLIVIHRVIANRELQVIPSIGTLKQPIYNTATGRALLSLYDDDTIEEILSNYSMKEDVIKKLKNIRTSDIEIDEGMTYGGIASVAIAINSFLGSFGIALLVPQQRFSEHKEFYISQMKKAKEKILTEIGTEKVVPKNIKN